MEIKQLKSTRDRQITVDLDGYRHNVHYVADDTAGVKIQSMEDAVSQLLSDGIVGALFGILKYDGQDIIATNIIVSNELSAIAQGMRSVIDFIEGEGVKL